MHRKKQLRPMGVPFGTATIDGKNQATLTSNPNGQGHARDLADEKWKKYAPSSATDEGDYYLFPVLRATLSSHEAAPVLYHLPIPPGGSESGSFHGFLDALHQTYGHLELFRVIDVDAGFTSLQNAQLITTYGYYYLMGLKENQPTLYQKAKNLFIGQWASKTPPKISIAEERNGAVIRRSLWVSNRLEGAITSAGEWSDVTEVWCVRQETEKKDGTVTTEDRYFLTSIPVKSLTNNQKLLMVRRHWVVENDVFNSLDLQWREDDAIWSTRGNAIGTLGVLRLLAYNIVQFLRKRHLCRKRKDGTRAAPLSWRELFEVITDVFKGLHVGQRETLQGSISIA
jgi:predicted transposase YbfD/YdcC